MISQVSQPRLKGFRFPRSIISYAIWAYHRFGLSLRDVEDLLAVQRDKQGENPASIKMRTQWWGLAERA